MPGVKDELDLAIDNSLENIDQFLEEFTQEFMQRVKQRTPVRTGLLQRSWESNIKNKSIEIWNDVEYASYIENGTPTISPFAMLQQTVEEADTIAKEIEAKLKG